MWARLSSNGLNWYVTGSNNMSKRRPAKLKASHQSSAPLVSSETCDKATMIKSSMMRHSLGENGGNSSEEEKEEGKHHGIFALRQFQSV